MKESPENIGKFFASKVTSKHNQNVMIRFVAIAGMGKSWAALQLASEISYWISKKLGGTPNDYFNFDKDFAVISLKKVDDVMRNAQKYHVILLDDIAAKAMNARNYASSESKDMNSIIQTWRPNHNALITTQQAGFLVDKVWRNLFNYQIEIVESHFNQGFVIAKVQQIVYKHNLDKTHYHYLIEGRNRYVRHIITAPPKEWQEAYEAERAIQLESIRKEDDEFETDIQDTKVERFTKLKFFTPLVLEVVKPYASCKEITYKEIIKRVESICHSAPSQSTVRDILDRNNVP